MTTKKETPKLYLGKTMGAAGKAAGAALMKAIKEGAAPDVTLTVQRVGDSATIEVRQYGVAGVACEIVDGETIDVSPEMKERLQKEFGELLDMFAETDTLQGKAYLYESKERLIGNIFGIEVFSKEEESEADVPEMVLRAVAEGKGAEEELLDKIQVLRNNLIPENMIEWAFENMVKAHDSATKRPEFTYQCDKDLIRKGITESGELVTNPLKEALLNMQVGAHMRIFGPPSGGKNVILDTACWIMNWDQIKFSSSSDTTTDALIGGYRLIDGETKVVLSQYMEGISKDECKWPTIFVIDESNSAPAGVLMKLYSVMDQTRAINVEGFGVVPIADHAIIAMTMNEDVIGTLELNPALVSRTQGIQVFANLDLESIFKGRFDKNMVAKTQKVVNAIENANQSESLGFMISIRAIIKAFEKVETGFVTLREALTSSVVLHGQDSALRVEISAIINQNLVN